MVVKALILIEEAGTLPLAQVDVLGASILERTTDALLAAGVKEICVVSGDKSADDPQFRSPGITYKKAIPAKLWEEARACYDGLAGADAILMMRGNAYAELEWTALFQRHRVEQARVTRVWSGDSEPLDVVVVDPQFSKDIAFLFHSHLRHTRLPATRYVVAGHEYAHVLASAADLREIATDALNLRTLMRPVGKEVRPGIWMAEHVRVDEDVRLVAPLFIGKFARIRTGAVITRGSSIEHHACVDCGTVVENTSVLPYATVGAGLDLSRAVVGHKRIFDLKRNVEVPIEDPTLISEQAHNAGLRIMAKAASLATYVPLQFWRGITARNRIKTPPACTSDVPAGVIQESMPKTRGRLRPELVMERYGNQ
jgi:hypothetical protein